MLTFEYVNIPLRRAIAVLRTYKMEIKEFEEQIKMTLHAEEGRRRK